MIGTGFDRTGMDSMREALEILGFGSCHHMRELIKKTLDMNVSGDQLQRGAKPDWDILQGGYASCVDWPAAYYFLC